jgi:hypothetical protein
MQVVPQANGALLVHDLSPETVYDMGNARVYMRCDSAGRIVSAHLAEGTPLQTMRAAHYLVLDEGIAAHPESATDIAHKLAEKFKATHSEGSGKTDKRVWTSDGAQIVRFETAQAIGRTWILSGQQSGLSVTSTTFMDRSSPAVFQRVQLVNQAAGIRVFALELALSLQFQQAYVSAGTVSSGRVHARLNAGTSFGATLHPWQIMVDKTQTFIRYALLVAPGHSEEFCLVSVAGDDAALERLLNNWREALADAEDYTNQLVALAANGDPLVQSLIVAGLNAGLSAYKELESGVAGFLAGVSYAYPPRAYFRDGYWTAQAALLVQPKMVREHLLWLARGVGQDGSCPSGVWDPGLFTPTEQATPGALNWLPDHYDSPSFFVMLLHDYVIASGDLALLDTHVGGVTMWQHALACIDCLTERDRDGDGLFEKPRAANDWADNVLRDGLVTYDLALFYRALKCAAWLAQQRHELMLAQRYEAQAERVQNTINLHLWDEQLGYYRAYQREGFAETHLSIDSLLTLLYGIADEHRAARTLDAARRLLQTRNNTEQAYGDWGVMCCYPFYHEKADLFSVSAEPYRYHNGADWPYWDGVYGLILLERDDPDWRYVLTRWWQLALEQGWLTPVEYAAPPHPHGGLLQGWSTFPAVALLSKKYANWLH